MPVFCSDYLPQVVAYGSKSVAETNFNIAVMTSENSWPGWNKIHRNKERVGNFSPFSLFFVGQVVTLNKGKSTHRTISKGQGLWTLFRVQVMKSELLEWLACFNEQNVCKAFDKYKVKNEIKRKNGKKDVYVQVSMNISMAHHLVCGCILHAAYGMFTFSFKKMTWTSSCCSPVLLCIILFLAKLINVTYPNYLRYMT